MYGGYPPQQPAYRPPKSYLGEALITLLWYYIGFWIVGMIANIIFLNNANRDQRMGMMVENKGCLVFLLWWHIVWGVLGCIGSIIFIALGGLAMLVPLISGY